MTPRGHLGCLGDGSKELAQEYHDSDFNYDAHAQQMAPRLQNQHLPTDGTAMADYHAWEAMYQQHVSAKFFKERRYLLLEFSHLAEQDLQLHVCELGAGSGASIMPVLKHVEHATATVFDVSGTALQQLQHAAEAAGIDASRVRAHVADCASPMREQLSCLHAHTCLIIFTLSAVLPEQQVTMLGNAYAALRPGGLLCIRDHGMYDMVQMRLKPEQALGPNLYRLQDGTISYFFTTSDLGHKCSSVGFTPVECKYATVRNVNRKTGAELRRVFVHGVFMKPAVPGGVGEQA